MILCQLFIYIMTGLFKIHKEIHHLLSAKIRRKNPLQVTSGSFLILFCLVTKVSCLFYKMYTFLSYLLRTSLFGRNPPLGKFVLSVLICFKSLPWMRSFRPKLFGIQLFLRLDLSWFSDFSTTRFLQW